MTVGAPFELVWREEQSASFAPDEHLVGIEAELAWLIRTFNYRID